MVKSSIIIAPITFVLVLISALLNNICCLFSPFFALLLGLAAGGLAAYFEKPAEVERALVRGAMAGAIAGAAALLAQTIGQSIALYIVGLGTNTVSCLPGLCQEGSAPASQTSWILYSFFNACFCGLMLLAVMALLGALGGFLGLKFIQKKPAAPPAPPAATLSV